MAWATLWHVKPKDGIFDFLISDEVQIKDPARTWSFRARVCEGIEPIITNGTEFAVTSFDCVISKSSFEDGREMEEMADQALRGKCHISHVDHDIIVQEACIGTFDEQGLKLLSTVIWLTDDLSLRGRFRGENPKKKQIKAALVSDLMGAICWKESGWCQFKPDGTPLKNSLTGGWGIGQVIGASNQLKWDWKANLNGSTQFLGEKESEAKMYLGKPKSYTKEMLEKETIQRFNGSVYHKFKSGKWVADPPNDYVEQVLLIRKEKPWDSMP